MTIQENSGGIKLVKKIMDDLGYFKKIINDSEQFMRILDD